MGICVIICNFIPLRRNRFRESFQFLLIEAGAEKVAELPLLPNVELKQFDVLYVD